MKKLILLLLLPVCIQAQEPKPLITTFPSLTIPASSRGWAMGNSGIAGASGSQQISYNVAATAFAQHLHQASAFYMPWLPGIATDTRFIHADYLTTMGNTSALGFAVSYLDLGTMSMRNDNGATLGLYKASEYHAGTSYALQLGGDVALGVTMRFLGQNVMNINNTYSFCGDVAYYQRMTIGSASSMLSWGAVVSNLGGNSNLPATAGIGLTYTNNTPTGDQLTVSLDANRLLKDDWQGLRASGGVEYGFAEQFFLRGGVNMESRLKGNRKFFSLGAGYKGFVSDQSLGIDVHYLVPFGLATAASPFQNSYSLTLSLNIGSFQ